MDMDWPFRSQLSPHGVSTRTKGEHARGLAMLVSGTFSGRGHTSASPPHPLSRLAPYARLLGEPSEPGMHTCLLAAQAWAEGGWVSGTPCPDLFPQPESDWASSTPDAPVLIGGREPRA